MVGPDEAGIKTVTEYKFNEAHQRVKVVKRYKVVEEITRTSQEMRNRRSWVKFGDVTGKEVGVVDRDFTMRSHDAVTIDHPNAGEKQQDFEEIWKNANSGTATSNTWTMKRTMGETTEDDYKTNEERGMRGQGGGDDENPNAYRPPAMRGGAENRGAAQMSDKSQFDHATLRVTNISEDAREQDLRELFAKFGHIARVYLAKDRETMRCVWCVCVSVECGCV